MTSYPHPLTNSNVLPYEPFHVSDCRPAHIADCWSPLTVPSLSRGLLYAAPSTLTQTVPDRRAELDDPPAEQRHQRHTGG